MGLLDRAIQKGVSRAIGNAVEQGVTRAVAPKVEQAAANAVNSAADQINQAAGNQQSTMPTQTAQTSSADVNRAANTLGGMFGSLQSAATSMANEAAKNMKICPSCGEGASADTAFCPKCGGKMPEQTVAEGAKCTSCGKQNDIGTTFCTGCGAKLPSAIADEQAAQAKSEAVMLEWNEKLPAYPKWNGGGTSFRIDSEDGYFCFSAVLQNSFTAQSAVNQYRALLKQSGFRTAGQYPDECHLYSMINGTCYHVDTEHCFDGDSNCPCIYFNISEPTGGFNYVKPEKKSGGFFDLFK